MCPTRYTWVDGSDPAHQRSQHETIPASAFDETVFASSKRGAGSKPGNAGGGEEEEHAVPRGHDLRFRFRDFGEASTLKYSIRSVEKFAPWVRKIWVVAADGQARVLFACKHPPRALP